MSFYRIIPGTKAQGGSGPPLASDVNQYAKAFAGEEDVGALALASPVAAPASAGSGTATTGSELGVGTHLYAVTYVTGHLRGDGTVIVAGETTASPTWSVVTTAGNQRVNLAGLPVPAGVTVVAKRLYRTVVDGAQLRLVAELAPGVESLVDNVTDASLGANVPTSNTTGTTLSVQTPTQASHVATKAYVDASGDTAPTANTSVRRDANGRAKVNAPVASDDIARKAEVDAAREYAFLMSLIF